MRTYLAILLFVFSTYSYSEIEGSYQLDVKIGEQNFKDILILGKRDWGGFVEGKFIVPNVFEAQFFGIANNDTLKGSFFAEERGESFYVELEASFISSCEITGTLSQDQSVFAHFIGKKEDCHESSP